LADEETYSLIFSSLKHPIRRKILRMLRDKELTFSQILEILSIDSGHLSYHLESLGDLVTHSSDGKYRLSSFGMAAVRLMSGVEEHSPVISVRRTKVDTAIRIFSIILVVTLLLVSIYAISSTTQTYGELVIVPDIPVAAAPNQKFVYNVTLTYGNQSTISEPNGISIETLAPEESVVEWEKYHFQLDFKYNSTMEIVLTILDPFGRILSVAPLGGPQGGSPGNLGLGIPAFFTQLGTYSIEIQNEKAEWFYANMTLHVQQYHFQRPVFYYGLAGIVSAFLYPVMVFLVWVLTKRDRQTVMFSKE
jgi:DNA-binding transcriptional ArsR family regulator